MKKLISVAFAGVAAAACAFAFTACGDKNQETSYTVNETEWKSAINFINEGKNSLNVDFTQTYDNSPMACKLLIDLGNNVLSFAYPEEDSDGQYQTATVYAWKDSDGKFYSTSYGWHSDDEGNVVFYSQKYLSNEEEYLVGIGSNIWEYAGGKYLTAILSKYGDFTYDEASKSYSAQLELKVDDYSDLTSYSITIKFENAKAVYFKAAYTYYDEYENKTYNFSDEFVYNSAATATVPDDIKKLPVTERNF